MRILITFLFLSSFVKAQIEPVLWQVSQDTILRYGYFFGDEFNGEKINEDLWYPNYPWGGLSIDVGIYADKKMVEPSNGVVKLHIDTTSEWRSFPKWMLDENVIKKHNVEVRNGNQIQLNHLISALWSKRQFKYGYFECRALVPSGKGLWPGFWLYGGHPNDEVDFMEMKGEKPKHFHVDIHCPDDCDKVRSGWFKIKKNWGGWVKASEQITDRYVVYSGLWTPGKLIMYLNGEAVAEYNGDFNTEMNLIANISVAQDGGPFSPGPDSKTVFPNTFVVDYMRVWKPMENDEVFKERPENVMRPTHIENALIDKESEYYSRAKLKRSVRHIFNKKAFKRHAGYVSVIQHSMGKMLVERNGNFEGDLLLHVRNKTGEKISSLVLSEPQQLLDLSAFKKGGYTLELNYKGQVSKALIQI